LVANQSKPVPHCRSGAGSGRFILAAGQAFPDAQLVAIETDPLSALMLRANLTSRGWIDRATLIVNDYRHVELPPIAGVTAFIGNPPYVSASRHRRQVEDLYASRFEGLASKRAHSPVCHLHFFLQNTIAGPCRRCGRTGHVG